jgi:enoyl-CoA hydratase
MSEKSRSELVLREVRDGVGIISMNRPEKHNAINDEMGAALGEATAWAIESPEVRTILLRGEGKSYSSGRDVTQLGHRARSESDYVFVRRAQDSRLRLMDCTKPVVAALRGWVLGGSFESALSADLRVAADDTRMGFPEVRYGIMTDTGGVPLITTLAGPSKAKWMIMTGEIIDAAQALTWGLVDWVVPPDELDDRAFEVARRLAAGPPLAIAATKQLVNAVWEGAVRGTMRGELLAQAMLFRSDDYQEARAAHREGRDPHYEGR